MPGDLNLRTATTVLPSRQTVCMVGRWDSPEIIAVPVYDLYNV